MTASDVTVSFGADTEDLTAALAAARGAINAYADQVSALGKEMQATSEASARGAQDQLAAALEVAQGEIKAASDATRQKIALYDEEYRAKQISEGQKVQSTIDALKQEFDQEQAILQQELALDDLRPQQRQRILNQLSELERTYAAEVQKVQLDAAQQSAAQRQKAFSTINGAFDSQINGLLRGTTGWSTAFKNVLATLTEDLIKFFLNWSLQQAESVALQVAGINTVTAAQVTGSAAQTAAQQSSAVGSAATTLATIFKNVAASAGEAFAGVFGFLAPVMGPAAAGPAAAAQATVLGVGIGSAEVGAWEIPNQSLWMLHPGEMVLPAGPAQNYRDGVAGNAGGTGGSGVTVNHATHFNVQALDSSDVKRWFKNNSKQIMRSVNDAVTHGVHLGLAKLQP